MVVWDINLYVVLIDYFNRFFIPEYFIIDIIVGWVVLMINAFKRINGLDGLAAGTAAIIFTAMAIF